VNRVFLTGTLKDRVQVRYSPKGERIALFPLWVDDGAFFVDVLYKVPQGVRDCAGEAGGRVMVSGMLTRAGERADKLFRLKANKIFWMEE
jgi:hypothetical protein